MPTLARQSRMRRLRLTPRERLARRLAEIDVHVRPWEIRPTRGYWLHDECDCMRWEATVRLPNGDYRDVGCWHTITECVRRDRVLSLVSPRHANTGGYEIACEVRS